MRKTPYLISLAVALVSLALTIVSISLPKWLRVPNPNGPDDLSYTGLYEQCQLRPADPGPPSTDPYPLPDPTLPLPPPGGSPPEPQSYSDILFMNRPIPPPITDPTKPSNPTLPPPLKNQPSDQPSDGSKYKCRPFPPRSMCERSGQKFCVLWASAGYVMQMSIVFSVITLITLSIVSFRFSTRSRRRGGWKAVGALTAVQVALQVTAMAMIVHLRQTHPTWFSDNTRYGASFIILIVSWSISTLLAIGIVFTGFAARAGHRWAAGKRGYHPIPDGR